MHNTTKEPSLLLEALGNGAALVKVVQPTQRVKREEDGGKGIHTNERHISINAGQARMGYRQSQLPTTSIFTRHHSGQYTVAINFVI